MLLTTIFTKLRSFFTVISKPTAGKHTNKPFVDHKLGSADFGNYGWRLGDLVTSQDNFLPQELNHMFVYYTFTTKHPTVPMAQERHQTFLKLSNRHRQLSIFMADLNGLRPLVSRLFSRIFWLF